MVRDAAAAGALDNPFRPEHTPTLSTAAKTEAIAATVVVPPPARDRAGTLDRNASPDAVLRALTA